MTLLHPRPSSWRMSAKLSDPNYDRRNVQRSIQGLSLLLERICEKEIANQHTWDLYAWSMMTIEFITGQTVDNREEGLALLKQNLGPKVGASIQELLGSAIAANPEPAFRH